jgi:outer membrane protein W
VKVMPLLAGVNFHLLQQSRVDLYVGPTIGYVLYGDFGVEDESLSIDDDFTWGATVGVDVPFGTKGWMFTGALRYLDTEASPEEMGPGDAALDVSPWIVQVSAGYRF